MKIISQENIKPSSPTPPHLKTHILSLADRSIHHIPVSFVFFYKNYNICDINFLKKSLSQCLTQYYPFAGRFSTPSLNQIDCTDEGVEFLEVSHDNRLDEFILRKDNDEILYELLPNVTKTASPYIVVVQVNHFNDGGLAVAVSASHKVSDAFTIITFINQWAKVTHGECESPPFKPTFFTSSTLHDNNAKPRDEAQAMCKSTKEVVKYVTKSFVFPNSKLHELKMKVTRSMCMAVQSPDLTRVEVLTSLLFKCSVDACTTNSGFFKPSLLHHPVNMRTKILKNDPEKAVGNLLLSVDIRMDDPHKIMMSEVVDKLRKGKMEIEEIRDVEKVSEKVASIMQMLLGDGGVEVYWTSSFCWFPLYEVNFGWGKPIRVKHATPKEDYKHLIMMDTPDRDGIEAIVRLPEEEMVIFQHDKELVAYIDAYNLHVAYIDA